ncbi:MULTISPECIES: hypothetical protein [Nocardioides]|nr:MULTISPECIES: hypothetical protein [unclassified Nocardioides]
MQRQIRVVARRRTASEAGTLSVRRLQRRLERIDDQLPYDQQL